ncbi:hypothetical protein AMECASPLE_014038 [Ameca splendens]|uniref:Uncharacterized protein n=1 Tax=Ameca splendens TaxID=208324 RepID=A0ABV1A9F9_9TELE
MCKRHWGHCPIWQPVFSALEAFIFDSRQTGRRDKERGTHSAKVAGSGTRTQDGRFVDYSLYMWSRANPYTTSGTPGNQFLRAPVEVSTSSNTLFLTVIFFFLNTMKERKQGDKPMSVKKNAEHIANYICVNS